MAVPCPILSAIFVEWWETKIPEARNLAVIERARYHQSEMQRHSLSTFSAILPCALALAAALAGCRSLPPSKPESEWTGEEARGAQVFQQACARCHYPTTTHSLHGPGLQAITKVQSMPSGAPPTNERLTAVILHGRNMMPPASLTDAQLSDLLAYLHTL
jgi:mono/diheme cytochrome c family protein